MTNNYCSFFLIFFCVVDRMKLVAVFSMGVLIIALMDGAEAGEIRRAAAGSDPATNPLDSWIRWLLTRSKPLPKVTITSWKTINV